MPAALTPRVRSAAAACVLLGLVAACSNTSGSGSTLTPNTAGTPTVVPGEAPKPGEGAGGGISITGTSIVRSGTKLTVTATIHNEESQADQLVQVGSEVTTTVALTPALSIPAGGTLQLGGTHKLVLVQNARLQPGGTVALAFQFTNAGVVQVFSSFLVAP